MTKVVMECDCCGEQKPCSVCASSIGPVSWAYCEDCLINFREPYGSLVAYVALRGGYHTIQLQGDRDLLLKNLEFYNKTINEFRADVDAAINKIASI